MDTAFFGSGMTIFALRNHAASASGAASGSERMPLRISVSVIAARRFQSVLVRDRSGRVDRRVVRLAFAFGCFSRTDNPPGERTGRRARRQTNEKTADLAAPGESVVHEFL